MMRRRCGRQGSVPARVSVLLGLVLLLFTAPCLAFFVPLHGGDGDKGLERRQVAQREREWRQALTTGDSTALDSLLSDSYVGIGPDGTIFNKAEEIQSSTSGANRISHLHVEDRKIRIYGSTAVVTSRVTVQGSYNGQPILGQYRYTRVWAFSRGQWHVVSFEANRIDDSSARRD